MDKKPVRKARLRLEQLESRAMLSGVTRQYDLPGNGPVVQIRLQTVDASGTLLSEIKAGESFYLQALVKDLRTAADAYGVFGAWADVYFNPSLVSGSQGKLPKSVYGAEYQNVRMGEILPGQIQEAGACGDIPLLDAREYVLWTVPLRADAAGLARFELDLADTIGTDPLVRMYDEHVPGNRVQLVDAVIQILTDGGSIPVANDFEVPIPAGEGRASHQDPWIIQQQILQRPAPPALSDPVNDPPPNSPPVDSVPVAPPTDPPVVDPVPLPSEPIENPPVGGGSDPILNPPESSPPVTPEVPPLPAPIDTAPTPFEPTISLDVWLADVDAANWQPASVSSFAELAPVLVDMTTTIDQGAVPQHSDLPRQAITNRELSPVETTERRLDDPLNRATQQVGLLPHSAARTAAAMRAAGDRATAEPDDLALSLRRKLGMKRP